jgi:hypothetical protein
MGAQRVLTRDFWLENALVTQDLIAAMRKLHAYSGRTYVPFTFDFVRVKSYEGIVSRVFEVVLRTAVHD